MAYVAVVPEGGKFKVLVNWIQRGVAYSSEAVANHEADKIKKDILENGGEVK